MLPASAALLQGICLPASDVDILVREREAVENCARALAGYRCLEGPERIPHTGQYYVHFEVAAVRVEVSTAGVATDLDVYETYGPGPWEHRVTAPCCAYQVPAVSLGLRLITELCRCRPERYEPLIARMSGGS